MSQTLIRPQVQEIFTTNKVSLPGTPQCTNKTSFLLIMHKRTNLGKRAGCPFFISRNTEVIIFSQALWMARVTKTDNDYVI